MRLEQAGAVLEVDRGALPALALDSLNAGVYVTDLERRIVYWNRAAERITGWPATEILGRACHDQVLCHVDKDHRQLCGHEFCPLHRAITTGTPSDVPSVVFALSAGGDRVPMRVSVAPLRDADGAVIGGVETFLDLSGEIADLERAQQIQAQCIVNEAADDARLLARIHFAPCDMIGGDFGTITRTGPDRYAFILADVTGHGLSAALYTMYLRSLWDDHCAQDRPAAILGDMNHRLAGVMSGGRGTFATAVCGVVDLKGDILRLSSAGGPAPLAIDDAIRRPADDLAGFPMGLVDPAEFDEIELPLRPGERTLLFSDGVVEIPGADGAQLGTDGLVRLLEELRYPERTLDLAALEEHMLAWSNVIRFPDDVTIMEIGRRAPD